MAGKGRSYREKRQRTVEAPSGAEFTIRKPGARAFTRLFEISGEAGDIPEDIEYALSDEGLREGAKEVLSQRSPDELVTSMDALILECVIDPKVVADETTNDDELWIEDIDMLDYFFLFKEATVFAGVTPEKLRELFRDLERFGRSTGGNDSDISGPKA